MDCEQVVRENPLDFAQHAATDKGIRDASVEASKKLSEFSVEMSMRKDIFDLVVAFEKSGKMDGLTAEQRRFVEKEIVHGRRNGLHLDQAKRDEITKVKKRISELGTQFSSNLSEDTTSLLFTRDELAGVPEDLVNSFEKEGDKLKVTTKYPHYFPVSRKCRVPETRRKLNAAFHSKCLKENTPILEELITLRQQQAELLGYATHADYIHEVRVEQIRRFVKHL